MNLHRRALLVLVAFAAIAMLLDGARPARADPPLSAPAGEAPAPADRVRQVLMIQSASRATPSVVALEQAFTSALRAALPDRVAFHNEYLDLGMFESSSGFEEKLVAYLAAKHARTRVDLVAVTASAGLRFALRHRTRLFAGVPIVFAAVDRRAAADIPLAADVSGVWLSPDWKGTFEAARRLQPDVERAVVVTGASPIDRVWAAEARAQLSRLDRPIELTFVENLSIDAVLARVAQLPARSVVLLGAFQADSAGRRFYGPEAVARVSAASVAPVYAMGDTQLGHGPVGGHVVSFERHGRQAAEIAIRMLGGERPPPIEGETNVYRFDARQLRRWGLDRARLPAASEVLFDEPSFWRVYGAYGAAGLVLLALQTWLIIGLLANRAERRRAQQTLADQLRFETLISDVLAGQLTRPASGVETQISRALALIGADLDVDRVMLAARDESRRQVAITHAWTRDGVPAVPGSLESRTFPWMARRLAEDRVVVVSPRHPLPAEAAVDRREMLALGTRSLLAVPLVVEGRVIGVLSCSTLRAEREWSDAPIERLRLLAEVFASTLARRRAEEVARESEERFRLQRQELTHALRVNTLGELGASLAHEINQPLSAILMNARAMSALLERGASEQGTMREALADIAADAKRAGDIIDRLRALARKDHVPERGLSLDALVDEVAGLLHQDFVRRGIAVRRVTAPGLPPLAGDRIQLQQIFLNLLVNAGDALEGTERESREITITTRQPTPRLVEVAVRDTGVGVKNGDLERMFERFVSTKPGGLGMGLAISRSIVEAHGGRIYAKANTERGITVYVELPADG